MERHYGYSQISQVKLIRKIHKVSFGDGISAMSLKDFLFQVPDSAKMVDLESNDDGSFTLVFSDEQEE